MRRLLVLTALLVALPAGAVTMDWVPIGNAGNAADPDTNTDWCGSAKDLPCGSVANAYYMSKYEVTNTQYAEFLNAKAALDPLGLYNANMGSDVTFGGITRTGSSGGYTYSVKAGFADKPVVYVSFYDALRFANWLNNGQGSGDTETGAYTITADGIANNTITRNPGAIAFLTNENEWYKAAYYDPVLNGGLGGYWDYPTGTDTPTTCTTPAGVPNTANCEEVVGALTDVGSYSGSASPYGTFDQGGNVWEWNEEIVSGSGRGVRGGSWFNAAGSFATWAPIQYALAAVPTDANEAFGFRVATLVPEPAKVLLVLTGGLVLAAARRQRRA